MEEEEKPEYKRFYRNVPAFIEQQIFRILAKFGTETRGSDLFYLYEAINVLIGVVGEDYLKYLWKDEYDFNRKKLMYYGVVLTEIKGYYDMMDKNGDVGEGEKKFIRKFKKMPMIQNFVPQLFVSLVKQTNLQYKKIPAEFFKKESSEYEGRRPLPRRPYTPDGEFDNSGEEMD